MYLLVQLNSPLSPNVGPNFSLTANVGTVVPATATATQLLTGVIALVSDSATLLTITAVGGDCPLTLNLGLPTPPTTTTTSTTTTIAPLCQCFLVTNPTATTANISYRDCTGKLTNFSLSAYSSIQLCGYNVTSSVEEVDIIMGGPCVSAEDGYVCDGCASESCTTYLVYNPSSTANTFSYINCDGILTTVTIPGTSGADVYGLNVCSCSEITSEILEVIVVNEDECEVCNCYEIFNPTEATLNFTWADCDKPDNIYTEPILPNQKKYQCSVSTTFEADPGLVVTVPTNSSCILFTGSGPSTIDPFGEDCPNPQSYCYQVTITGGSATIEYVSEEGILSYAFGSDTILYLCAWEGSVVKSSGFGTVVITGGTESCAFNYECEPCFCYTVYNTGTVGSIEMDYVDCEFGVINTETILAGASFTYCGKYPLTVSDNLSILKGGSCTVDGDCSTITTTTTTEAPIYFYYTAQFLNLETCNPQGPTIVIRSESFIMDTYVCIDGNPYQLISTVAGPSYDLTFVPAAGNSGNSCSPIDFVC
jgi:hypothetical protein